MACSKRFSVSVANILIAMMPYMLLPVVMVWYSREGIVMAALVISLVRNVGTDPEPLLRTISSVTVVPAGQRMSLTACAIERSLVSVPLILTIISKGNTHHTIAGDHLTRFCTCTTLHTFSIYAPMP